MVMYIIDLQCECWTSLSLFLVMCVCVCRVCISASLSVLDIPYIAYKNIQVDTEICVGV